MPVTVPVWSAVNLTPTLVAFLSESLGVAGIALGAKMVHGQVFGAAPTVTPGPGVSRLPLSSAARLLIVTWPEERGVQLYVHAERPVAGCQVVPPSTDTSTPPTTPPP